MLVAGARNLLNLEFIDQGFRFGSSQFQRRAAVS